MKNTGSMTTGPPVVDFPAVLGRREAQLRSDEALGPICADNCLAPQPIPIAELHLSP
jgi:hypothetical protein